MQRNQQIRVLVLWRIYRFESSQRMAKPGDLPEIVCRGSGETILRGGKSDSHAMGNDLA